MKLKFNVLGILFILFFTQLPALSQIAVIDSSSNANIFRKGKFGNYNSYINKLKNTLNKTGINYTIYTEDKIPTISIDEYKITVVPFALQLSDNNINYINKYISKGGKIILITPPKSNEKTSKLFKILGTDLKKIKKIKHRKYINWIEKTFANNYLSPYSTYANVELDNKTNSIAVWDEIEKNEPAITINNKGSLITWLWGIEGDEQFNIKSFQNLVKMLDPNIQISDKYLYSFEEFAWGLDKINTNNNECSDKFDILLTEKNNRQLKSMQEYAALSDIHQRLAIDNFINKNYDLAYKEREIAQKCTNNAYILSSNPQQTQGRAIWFDRGTIVKIKNKKEMKDYFELIEKSGLNIVYFETLNAGYTIYPSKIAEQNPLTRGKDPLKWAIHEAHKREIELHPWVWVFAAGNDRHNPIVNKPENYPGPILENHKNWLLLGPKGNKKPINQHEFWIDPSNEQARAYLISIIEEIAQNYDIDGIQLDYIRYPFQKESNLMGFNQNSKYKFEKETGEKLSRLNAKTMNSWNNWKEKNISSFVEKVSDTLEKIDPKITISAAVFGKNQYSRFNTIQQNWEFWTYKGWVDILNPMIYALDNDTLKQNLVYFSNKSQSNSMIYPGLAIKHLDTPELLTQIDTISNYGLNGNTLFAVAYLDEETKQTLAYGPNQNSNVLNPTKYPLKSARTVLKEYIDLIKIYRQQNTISDVESTELEKITEAANILYSYLYPKNISHKNFNYELNRFKKLNHNWINNKFKYNTHRKTLLKSYIYKLENLVYYYTTRSTAQ